MRSPFSYPDIEYNYDNTGNLLYRCLYGIAEFMNLTEFVAPLQRYLVSGTLRCNAKYDLDTDHVSP